LNPNRRGPPRESGSLRPSVAVTHDAIDAIDGIDGIDGVVA
jgi:hypothetical protein